MRIVNPYPWGHAPRGEDITGAIAQCAGGDLLRASGARVGSISCEQLAALGEVREDVAPFDEQYGVLYFVAIEGPAGRIATLKISEDAAVHYQGASPQDMWTGFAPARDPRALLQWLAQAGAPGPLARFDHLRTEAGQSARSAWRAATPPSLTSRIDEVLDAEAIPPSFAPDATARLEAALGSREAAIRALLAWYGVPAGALAMRGSHEHVTRLLLSRYGFDEVVRTFAGLGAAGELAGAGRYVLDAAPMPPVLASTIAGVPEPVREAMVAALAQSASPDDAAALRAWLFPAPVGAPAGTALVGISGTVKLRRPVADGAALFAIDGTEIARFEGGKRAPIAMLLREAPLAVHDGALLFRTGSVVQRRALDGSPLPSAAAPTPEEAAAARARSASWTAPAPPGLVAIAPSAHEIEAFESFAHLGLPPPPAARVVGRAFLDPSGPALLRAAPVAASSTGAPASLERVALPGEPVAAAVTPTAIVVLAKAPTGIVQVTVPDAGPACASDPIALDPAAISFFVASERAAFLGIDTGAGILVARADIEPAAG